MSKQTQYQQERINLAKEDFREFLFDKRTQMQNDMLYVYYNANFISIRLANFSLPVVKISKNTLRVWENSVYRDILTEYAEKTSRTVIPVSDRRILGAYNGMQLVYNTLPLWFVEEGSVV